MRRRILSFLLFSTARLLLTILFGVGKAQNAPKPTPEVQNLLDQANKAENAYHHDEALQLYSQALTLARTRKDPAGEARTLDNLGVIYRATGQPRKAVEFFQPALATERAIGDKN